MSKADFIKRRAAASQKTRRFLLAGLLIFVTGMIPACICGTLEESGSPAWLAHLHLSGILGSVAMITFAICFVVAASGDAKGLPCHNCGRRLAAIPAQIAVASGHCGYCGEKAFED